MTKAEDKSWFMREVRKADAKDNYDLLDYLNKKVDEALIIFMMFNCVWLVVSSVAALATWESHGWLWLTGALFSFMGLGVGEFFRVRFGTSLVVLLDRETKRMRVNPNDAYSVPGAAYSTHSTPT